MEMVAGGREGLMSELYRDFARMVYKISLKGTQNHEAAEDVSQQVFMNIFRSLEGFRRDCKLKTWIHQITLNECHQYRLKHWRENRKIQAYLDERPEGREEEGDWCDRLLVGRILDMADPQTRKALEMIYEKGLTHEQIAEAFGVSRIAVTKRVERFRVKVADSLRAEGRSRPRNRCGSSTTRTPARCSSAETP